jgi:Tfp pilus assembly protein PilF
MPNLTAAINNLAWLYYELKDPRAVEMGKKAYELAPNAGPVLDTYGWILVETGKYKEGIELLERATVLEPGNAEIARHLKEAKARSK